MQYFNEFIRALEKLISFESVKTKKVNDMPFGEGVYGAYKYFINLASSFGFETINYDNYIGEVVFGEGEEIGIIGHVDVVPAGSAWNTPPYTLTKVGNTYFGRGLADDKAPLLLCLFILKELKESNQPVNKKFRLIVGCDEESGWQDIAHFNKVSSFPEYGFSPDGNFPVSYAEKGIAYLTFKLPKLKKFFNVKGGTVLNAVCGLATVETTLKDVKISNERVSLKGKTLESVGKSAHGSCPQNGINAIKLLYETFLENGEDVKNVLDCLFNDKFGLFKMETEQGNVTYSPNVIEEKEDGIYLYCDCRFPYPITENDLREKLNKFNIPYELVIKHDTQYVNKDGEFVKTLLNSYNKVMGENASPIAQGGSTFARAFTKGVAFGPEFIGVPSTIHQPNERLTEEELLKLYNIYKTAIFNLAK